jgi:hypothetical protein
MHLNIERLPKFISAATAQLFTSLMDLHAVETVKQCFMPLPRFAHHAMAISFTAAKLSR